MKLISNELYVHLSDFATLQYEDLLDKIRQNRANRTQYYVSPEKDYVLFSSLPKAVVQLEGWDYATLLHLIRSTTSLWPFYANFYLHQDMNWYMKHNMAQEVEASARAKSLAVLRGLVSLKGLNSNQLKAHWEAYIRSLEPGVNAVVYTSQNMLVADTINIIEYYKLYLPTNYCNISKKMSEFRALNGDMEAERWMCANKYRGNENRKIVGKNNHPCPSNEGELGELPNYDIQKANDLHEWHMNTLFYLYTAPGMANKLSQTEVYRRYTLKCAKMGVIPVSLRTAQRAMKKTEHLSGIERHGLDFINAYLPEVRGSRPEYALAKGGIDGMQVDFYCEIGKENAKASKWVMLTIVIVADYYSDAITGYAIGLVENAELVRKAYRNHLATMKGYTYHTLQMDQGSANAVATKQVFERVVKHVESPTLYYKGKNKGLPNARKVERIVQELNRLTQGMNGWNGTNVTSQGDKNRKPNNEYSKTPVSIQEAIKQVHNLVKMYNHDAMLREDGRSKWEVLHDIQKTNKTLQGFQTHEGLVFNTERLTALQIAESFLQKTVITPKGGLVEMQVAKREYIYRIDMLKYAYLMPQGTVTVFFDPDNMESVECFGNGNHPNPSNGGEYTMNYIGTLPLVQRLGNKQIAEIKEITASKRANISLLQRKNIEAEAVYYGVDVTLYPDITQLNAIVEGLRSIQADPIMQKERYAQALENAENWNSNETLKGFETLEGLEIASENVGSDLEEVLVQEIKTNVYKNLSITTPAPPKEGNKGGEYTETEDYERKKFKALQEKALREWE